MSSKKKKRYIVAASMGTLIIVPIVGLASVSYLTSNLDASDVVSVKNELDNKTFATSKNDFVLNWKDGQDISLDDLGITISINFRGTKLMLIAKSVNVDEGSVKVLITITKGGFIDYANIIVNSFLSKNQFEVNQIAKSFHDMNTTRNDYYPLWMVNKSVTATELGIAEPPNKGDSVIMYHVLSIQKDIGDVEVQAKITKNGYSAIANFHVLHFETLWEYWQELLEKPIDLNLSSNETWGEFIADFRLWTQKFFTSDDETWIHDITLSDDFISHTNEPIDVLMNHETLIAQGKICIYFNNQKFDYFVNLHDIANSQDQIDVNKIAQEFKTSQITTNSSFYPQAWVVDQQQTLATLGIEQPDANNSTITYTIKGLDLINGQVIVLVKITKNGKSASVTVTVNGFKTTAQQNQNDVDVIAHHFIAPQTTTNTSFYPNSWTNGQVITINDLGIIEPSHNDATITYIIQSIDLETGQVVALATITKNGKSASVTVTVNGFKTTAQQNQNDIEIVSANFIKQQITINSTFFPERWLVGQSVTLIQLGISEPNNKLGTIITYIIQSIDLETGQVVVVATIKKGNQSITPTITINGFKTMGNENEDDVNIVVNKFISPQTTTNTNFYPHTWVNGQSVNQNELGIVEPDDKLGTIINYAIQSINLTTGQVIVVITAIKGIAHAQRAILVNGFRTTTEQNRIDVNIVASNFTSPQITTNSSFYPHSWTNHQSVMLNQLGIVEPSDIMGTVIIYTIKSINLITGQVIVLVTITKGTQVATISVTINGFRTTAQQNQLDIDAFTSAYINPQTTTNTTFYPHAWTIGQIVTSNQLGINEPPNNDIIITYHLQSINLTIGQIIVVVTAVKGDKVNTFNLIVNGFRTTAEQNQTDVDEIVANYINPQITTNPSFYPDSWVNGQAVMLNQLGIVEPNFNGTIITYTIQAINLSTGIVIVNVRIAKGTQVATISVTINGFRTTIQQNQVDVDTISSIYVTPQTTTNVSFYPDSWVNGQSITRSQLGINEPPINGTTITYMIQSINLTTGQVVVLVTIAKGSQRATISVTINGFRTTTQQNQVDVDVVASNYLTPQTTTNVTFYPSSWTINQVLTLSQLAIIQPSLNGSIITYNMQSINLTTGQVVVIATIKKGLQTAVVSLTINGFKTTNQQNLEDITSVANAFTTPQTTTNSTFYPIDWLVVGTELVVAQLGIVEPLKNGASISYITQSVNLAIGQVVVIARIIKGTQIINKTLIINGFVTDQTIFNQILAYLQTFNTFNPFSLNFEISTLDLWLTVLINKIKPSFEAKFGALIASEILWTLNAPNALVLTGYNLLSGKATQGIKFSFHGIVQSSFFTMYFNKITVL